MPDNKLKSIKLRAFRLENNEISKSDCGLLSILSDKLKCTVVGDRRMILNPEDPAHEEDLLSFFNERDNICLFGICIRLMPSKDVSNFPDELFKVNKIEMSELDAIKESSSNVVKDHYYYMLDNDHLIVNLPSNITIMRFQTYINWLLQNDRGKTLFEFTPMITEAPQFKISDIKNIKIQDTTVNPLNKESKESSQGLFKKNISLDIIKEFLTDVKSLDEVKLSQIVSAELLVKFTRKPKDMTKEEYEKLMGAYLKPISDIDNLVIVPKKGAVAKGKDILRVKAVDIEMTETGKISENQLLQEMEKFLRELKDEKYN